MTDRVLVIEDDPELGKQITRYLEEAGFEPTWITDGDEARGAEIGRFALIILDLMLPGTYGLDLLKRFREQGDVPVLILSARNDTADRVRGLKLGADDYLGKPFWPEELLARVTARLRRPTLKRGDVIHVGRLRIDPASRTVHVEGRPVDVTPVEMTLLLALARRPGAAVTRAALVDAALDPEQPNAERNLDVHVSRLRRKLGEAGRQIATVWGIGYRLDAPSRAEP
jgi:two-component system response regulator MtrA